MAPPRKGISLVSSEPRLAWRVLESLRTEPRGFWLSHLSGSLAAILTPLIFALLGVIAHWIGHRGIDDQPIVLGQYLALSPPQWFVQSQRPVQLYWLIGLGLALSTLQALALWLFYRSIQWHAGELTVAMHHRVLQSGLQQASQAGVSMQRRDLQQLMEQDLPTAVSAIQGRWRSMPRSLFLLLGCAVLAILVEPRAALLTLLGSALVWHLYRWLHESADRTEADEQLRPFQRRLLDAMISAPLMGRVQPTSVVQQTFEEQLRVRQRMASVLDGRSARVLPLVTFAAAWTVGLCLLLLGKQSIVNPAIGLPASLVLTLAALGAAAGAGRLLRASMTKRNAGDNALRLARFIDRGPEEVSAASLSLAGIRSGLTLDRVMLHDPRGKALLQSLSLKFTPGEMVCVLSTDDESTESLLEMVVGLGKPQSGQVMIDGENIQKVKIESLQQWLLWIDPTGPLWTGSIEQNLVEGAKPTASNELYDVLQRCRILDRLRTFSDGLGSMVAPDDHRIDATTRYAIGVARALLRNAKLIVAREPAIQDNEVAEACLRQLRLLADDGAIVVIGPSYLPTLRAADRVIIVHQGKLAADGSHGELLEKSDLYRHMNYVLFNPFAHQVAEGS
jgi:ATP-binding cassette, subfamily B, bacterial